MKLSVHKTEFSKVILIAQDALMVAVTVGAFILMFLNNDLEPLAYIIPAVATESAAAHALYYWKAKAENVIKLRELHGEHAEGVEDL